MNVTFDDSTGTAQHVYHEEQDTMSQISSTSSKEQIVPDLQKSQSNRYNALPDDEQSLRPSSTKSGAFPAHNSNVTGASSETYSGTQAN